MTRVEGTVVRSTTEGLYEDITGPGVRVTPGRGYLDFDDDLTTEQVAAVRERMCSKDDVDQARRSALRDAAALLDEGDPLRLTICYVLGE